MHTPIVEQYLEDLRTPHAFFKTLGGPPSSDEQREAVMAKRNIERLAAYQLKRAALIYARLHRFDNPRAVVIHA